MIAILVAAAALIGSQHDPVQPIGSRSPAEIANATTFDLAFRGTRVVGCTVTATSGYSQIDRYVCDAARSCAEQYSSSERRADCLAEKREELAELIAKKTSYAK